MERASKNDQRYVSSFYKPPDFALEMFVSNVKFSISKEIDVRISTSRSLWKWRAVLFHTSTMAAVFKLCNGPNHAYICNHTDPELQSSIMQRP